MILKCFIIDDEPGARFATRNLLKAFVSDIEIVGEADGIQSALEQFKIVKPHLVFLDLEMPHLFGFELFKSPDKPGFEVVITTAYDDRALDAFRYGVADYLVKPLNEAAIKRAVSRVRRILAPLENAKVISLQTNEGTKLIPSQEIVRLEADRNYSLVFGDFGKTICSSKNLGHFEQILEKCGFFRVHHSHLISLYHIHKLNKSDNSIEMKDGHMIPVSREKKKRLIELFDLVPKVENE